MADQVQYIVSSDGWVLGFTETNGVGGGILNLRKLPSAYRTSLTSAQELGFGSPDGASSCTPHARASRR